MSIAFSAVLLDITAEKEGTEERTQKNENKACALPHDPGETMTIKWPAADPPLLLSVFHSFPFYPFQCTLMYKIASIHKQRHYSLCLPTSVALSSSHRHKRTDFPFSPKKLSGTFCCRLFRWSWVIWQGVKNCRSTIA